MLHIPFKWPLGGVCIPPDTNQSELRFTNCQTVIERSTHPTDHTAKAGITAEEGILSQSEQVTRYPLSRARERVG